MSRWFWKLIVPVALLVASPAKAQDEEPGGASDAAPDEGPKDEAKPRGLDVPMTEAPAPPPVAAPASAAPDQAMMTSAPAGYTKASWPLADTVRPITLAKGMLEIRADALVNLSKDEIGKPFSLAPDLYYGVSDQLSIGLTHEVGLCLSGQANGCPKVYNDVGSDAIYALKLGRLDLGARAGVALSSLSPALAEVKLGVIGKWRTGQLALELQPTIAIGVNKRSAGNIQQFIDMPIDLEYQATPQLAARLATGIGGPTSGFGDAYQVPLEVGVLYAISHQMDVGARIALTNLLGKEPPGVGRADQRALAAFVNFRL